MRPLTLRRSLLAWLLFFVVSGCAVAAQDAAPAKVYDVTYTVTPHPRQGTATVELRVSQARRLLRELSMEMPESRYNEVGGDGEIRRDGRRVHWLPPATGGVLRWSVTVAHRRYGETYDAWLGKNWGLFRATDIMPPARTRTLAGARSNTVLRFDLPQDWSSVTPYRERNGVYPVTGSARRFDRPAGWMLLGKLGKRLETIAGVRVVVAGPTGENVRRMDMLALLQWTLPELKKVLAEFPQRLTIVSASKSMWRGGLSGPNSLYLHASLPLISENSTSTLLHELLHIGMGLRGAAGADWIVEGLAEYYSLELLRRSGTLSDGRFTESVKNLVEWGKDAKRLCSAVSTGAETARAVGVFAALQRDLYSATKNPTALDELLRALVTDSNTVSLQELRRLATAIAGKLPASLSSRNLPGCG